MFLRIKHVAVFIIAIIVCIYIITRLTCFNFSIEKRETVLHSDNIQFVIPKDVNNNFPNVPEIFFKNYDVPAGFNETCARFPKLRRVKYNNYFWQVLESSDGNYHFLNAYLDDRIKNKTIIRVLGMLNRLNPALQIYCQVWYNDEDKPFISQVNYTWIWKESFGFLRQGLLHPYLFSCEIPNDKQPSSVSLVEEPCDFSTTNLRVIYEKPKQKAPFGMCVKGLAYSQENLTIRLVEWIELMLILGVEKIHLYELQIHEEYRKVLQYYEKLNKIEVNSMTLPGYFPNIPAIQKVFLEFYIGVKRLNEVLLYNDCFYKNMYKYNYIALLDIDEVIMPIVKPNWKETVENLENVQDFDGISFYNTYFLDSFLKEDKLNTNIPKEFHILQHVYRTRQHNEVGAYMKSFFNTLSVLTLHNHHPFKCLFNECLHLVVNEKFAHLQHYRKDCVSDFTNCDSFKKDVVKDESALKYTDVLIRNVKNALNNIKLLIN